MKCKYTHPDGRPCKSPGVLKDGPGAGYCIGHARKLKLLPREWEEERARKMSASQKKRHAERAKEETDFLWSNQTEKEKEDIKNKNAEDLYHNIIGDKDFDLEELKQDLIEMGEYDKFRDSEDFKLGLFVEWFQAEPETRNPKTVRDAANVLEIRQMKVREWMRSDDFLNKMDEKRVKTAKLIGPAIDRINHLLAINGNKNAIAKFYDQFGRPEIHEREIDALEEADRDLMDEAERIVGDGKGKALNLTDDEVEITENLIGMETLRDESEE